MVYADIAVVVIYTFANALADTLKIQYNWKLFHGVEGALQFIALAGIAFLADGWLDRGMFLLLNLSVFWLLFDYALNWLRRIINGEHWIEWWHLGDAILDQILKGFENRWKRLILKLTIVAATLTLNLVL